MTDINTTRQFIAQHLQGYTHDKSSSGSNDDQLWYILGTSGCHLCDHAENMLNQFSNVYPINLQYVDISEFETEFMMKFAESIPVLLTPKHRLDYPFSLVDLQGVYQK